MRKSISSKLMFIMVAALTLVLAACSSNEPATTDTANTEAATSDAATTATATTVEITDAHGTVTVPVNPTKVVALDNRTFETLSTWGVKLAAAPKDVMPADSPYVADESVQNIGNH